MKLTTALILAGSMVSLFAEEPADKLEADENSAAFWNMTVVKDGKIQDGSGYDNDMVLGSKDNAPLPTATEEGLVFDGEGGYAFVKKAKDSLRIKGDFTLEVVFKWTESNAKNTGFALIGNKAASEKKTGFAFGYSNWMGKFLTFEYALNDKAETFKVKLPKGLTTNVWHYAAVVRKGDKLSIYLDGQMMGETTVAGTMELYQARPIAVGIYSAAWQRGKDGKLILNPFRGIVKTIRISDKARDFAAPAK